MGLSSDILGMDDLRTREVFVPAWKRSVMLRELGLAESMQSLGALKPDKDGKVTLTHNEIAQIVAYGVIDAETGERAFSDADIPKLARKNPKALMQLYTEIVALSGTVEDEVKN